MPTTAAPPKLFVVKSKLPFGPCLDGDHSQCPGRISAPIEMTKVVGGKNVSFMATGHQIQCSCGQCLCTQAVRCLACNHRVANDVDPNSWACLDQDACAARQSVARGNNPTLLLIKEIRAMSVTTETENVTTTEGEAVEAKPKRKKEGVCLVTGEPTKGGLFKPGMDARYVKERVAEVLTGDVTEDAVIERMQADGTSETLQAKFRKSLGLARERAEAKAKAAEAKAAEPTEEQAAEAADEAVAES